MNRKKNEGSGHRINVIIIIKKNQFEEKEFSDFECKNTCQKRGSCENREVSLNRASRSCSDICLLLWDFRDFYHMGLRRGNLTLPLCFLQSWYFTLEWLTHWSQEENPSLSQWIITDDASLITLLSVSCSASAANFSYFIDMSLYWSQLVSVCI